VSNVRIIAGKWRRRKLASPEGRSTRPPTDFIRENIFNILRDDIEGASVLDLFAGSGSFGIEALSRGAGSCIFVENGRAALRALKENLRSLEVGEAASVLMRDVFRARNRIAEEGRRFDLIFCDPPFDFGRDAAMRQKAVEMVDDLLIKELLSEDGVLVFRSHTEDAYEKEFSTRPGDTRVYGKSAVFFFYR